MDESISFYENLLNFETRVKINNGEKEICFLSHDGLPQFEIELIRDLQPSTSYSEHGLVNHLAFVVEDIEKAVSHFKQAGVTFITKEPKNGLYGRKGIRFKGPSGEILQFVQEPSK